MNREIKFRAWLKNQKKMIDVSQINFTMENVSDGHFNYYDFDDIELMQYSGLKDKNGIEIYEGDIVKINGFHYEIFYAQEECCFKMKRKYDDLFLTKIKEKHIEVIGNIYKNKELLKNE